SKALFMPRRNIVVLGASAGGIPALLHIAANLPRDLNASLFVVVHTSADSPAPPPPLPPRAGPAPASVPINGEEIRSGRIYVAPPDYHLLIKNGRICVARGPKENGFRPAVRQS